MVSLPKVLWTKVEKWTAWPLLAATEALERRRRLAFAVHRGQSIEGITPAGD